MTDLNISLWGVGITVILAVIVYNFWQEYKARKNVERAFGKSQDDVLMRTADAIPNSASGASAPSVRLEPSLQEQPADAAVPRSNNLTQDIESRSLPIDEFIDCVIPLEFELATSGEKILSEIQTFRRVGNKPVQFIGVNSEGQSEVIVSSSSYIRVLAGVQLVTRSGVLNELEYSELVMKLRQVADNLNAHPDIPDMAHVMDAGRDLHLFVTEHDAQLSVNVRASGAPWGISTLLAALEKHGFDERPDGRLVMSDGEGGALFTLSTNCGVSEQATNHITLLLDVPCVAPSRGGFKAMVSCAKLLALRLGGSVVDDSGQLLTDATFNQIQEQVDAFYSEMQEAQIPAGSTRAVRLFS